jgi:hypothetical protein
MDPQRSKALVISSSSELQKPKKKKDIIALHDSGPLL